MFLLNKSNKNKEINAESLQKIIDEQNKELLKLRWISTHIVEYEEKKKVLDEQISEYERLSDELGCLIKEQKQLNRELRQKILECKNESLKIKMQYENGGM